MTVGAKAVAYAGGTLPRELSRFFLQVGHEITYMSSGNHNYQKCQQKLDVHMSLENKAFQTDPNFQKSHARLEQKILNCL